MKEKAILLILTTILFNFGMYARVSKIEITERKTILNGKEFGKYGAYEYLKGTVWFEIDPFNQYNSAITDIEYAPLNEHSLIVFSADFEVLQPVELGKSSGIALVEVSNRGGKFSLNYFNRATKRGINPNDPECFGDELLMRKGLTIIWIGWQWDVPKSDQLMNISLPIAKKANGGTISGVVRSDWVIKQTINTLKLAHRNQIGYPVSNARAKENILTVRKGRDAKRDTIDPNLWQFGKEKNGKVSFNPYYIYMQKGFEAGKIYELVYKAKNPVIAGLGMTAVRDIIDYAKNDTTAIFPVKMGIAAGVSQTGRFLRHFIYQDFNTTESGSKAYDGMMIMTAGAGRGSFNHRFAQPSRDAHRYSAFFYPTDIFPFTSRNQIDYMTANTDGLFNKADKNNLPLIMYINTGYEYWGRAASLIHLSVDGKHDIAPFSNERIYHIASAQHFVNAFPPKKEGEMILNVYRGNHLEFKVNYRALLVKLTEWIQGKTPPANSYPQINDANLVEISALKYPRIPNFVPSKLMHTAYRADYGPQFSVGIIEIQPPELGPVFHPKVPQVDQFGNELGGIRNIELQVPLATYIPYNLRLGLPGEQYELNDFYGTFIPLAMSSEKKEALNDERPDISSLYKNKNNYLKKVKRAANKLIKRGFLLKEDRSYVLRRAEDYWDFIMIKE
ncbi:MAG: alpha/beta hydrolase domain-containing protein [Bacteroidota bacterium]